ncbi:Release factor glutamine methyltransferase [Moorella thermoacetica]|uniref:Release factor glutamine methyltransferase n=2 Tax=Neomoorella thermoacetica TaxID=1525 RepID=A0AAC9HK09_NEOTH|nr:peptide chain release factor N(5)-glutamine methyltransferase [Moorella thermoacetica]AOQ25369.1 Release factor glutamine methyltransferase [Moorella thermoacetica]TYL11930.1 Release factor glutamine methyltransferase [Moorella thermoacetica]
MTLRQALGEAVRRLAAGGVERPRLEAEVLLGWACNLTRPRLLARLEEEVAPAAAGRFWQAIDRRAAGYPLQYLTGHQEFMSLDFKVTPAVLIPRQDTEVVVEAVLERLDPCESYTIADCGTGSGAIALSLAHYLPRARVYATDISPAALTVARENARKLGLAARVTLLQGDFLAPLRGLKLDALVANPPYIPTAALPGLPADVRSEPRLALDGGPDGLDAYRLLLPGAAGLLRPGGLLALEIGSDQGQAVKDLARAVGAYRNEQVLPDYAGRDRCFLAYRREE